MVESRMRLRRGARLRDLLMLASACLTGCAQGSDVPSELRSDSMPSISLSAFGRNVIAGPSAAMRRQTKQPPLRAPSAERAPFRADPFRGLSECQAVLAAAGRVVRSPETARIGTWNIRWFPDGIPGNTTSASRATDLPWLACALAYLNLDAIALAEVKSKPRSGRALEQVMSRLNELTGGRYSVRMDECPDANGLHVAWLVNEQRVTVTDWQMHASLNPNGEACAGQLRPGLGARFRFPGGLDLHAIAIHFKSGVTPRDLEMRRTSFESLDRVVDSIARVSGDTDVLVAGDFNTMGCRECPLVARGAAEASWLDTRLKSYRLEARRVPSDLGCSHYYHRQPSLLDHFLVTTAMREVPAESRASVHGYCKQLHCESYAGADPESARHLSDHCPVVLELQDHDWD